MASRSGGFMSSGMLAAERTDEAAGLDAVEHDSRGRAIPEGAEPDERGLSGGTHVRPVLMGVDDECPGRARGELRKGAARLLALLERTWVVTEEELDFLVVGEAP